MSQSGFSHHDKLKLRQISQSPFTLKLQHQTMSAYGTLYISQIPRSALKMMGGHTRERRVGIEGPYPSPQEGYCLYVLFMDY